MSSRNYSIPILNELHELYPDILYRPYEFQTSDDIIQYIIDRGVRNRFHQESERYRQEAERQRQESVRYRQQIRRQNIPTIIHPARHRPSTDTELYNIIHGASISSDIPAIIPNPSSIEQLFSLLLRENIEQVNNDSLNNIRPTEDQLNRNTTVYEIVDENNTACAICQDTLNDGQMARRIHHCSHTFHQSCVDIWFERHATCPTCRHDIRNG